MKGMGESLIEFVEDPVLRMVLSARWSPRGGEEARRSGVGHVGSSPDLGYRPGSPGRRGGGSKTTFPNKLEDETSATGEEHPVGVGTVIEEHAPAVLDHPNAPDSLGSHFPEELQHDIAVPVDGLELGHGCQSHVAVAAPRVLEEWVFEEMVERL